MLAPSRRSWPICACAASVRCVGLSRPSLGMQTCACETRRCDPGRQMCARAHTQLIVGVPVTVHYTCIVRGGITCIHNVLYHLEERTAPSANKTHSLLFHLVRLGQFTIIQLLPLLLLLLLLLLLIILILIVTWIYNHIILIILIVTWIYNHIILT